MKSVDTEGPEIVVLDYRLGNRTSVINAFNKVGANTSVSCDPDEIFEADGLVIPGVGAFAAAMNELQQRDLINTLNRFRELGKPILGVCLGMQLFFDSSSELCKPGTKPTEGLGWLSGPVNQLNKDGRLNIGWANVEWTDQATLNAGIIGDEPFYHLHGYVCEPEDPSIVASYTDISTREEQKPLFVSAIQKDNIYGVQFHPEKSNIHPGLTVIKNFCEQASLMNPGRI